MTRIVLYGTGRRCNVGVVESDTMPREGEHLHVGEASYRIERVIWRTVGGYLHAVLHLVNIGN